ncbi:MAG: alpha/beta hydrolase [Pseudomonadota bacterium]
MNGLSPHAIEGFKDPATAARYFAAYDALLAKWPVPFESIQLSTPLGATHILVSGPQDAPPLVLLHGGGGTALVWRVNVEALSRHFRVYAIDIIGQLGRSLSNRKIKNRQDYAQWLCGVFDMLGIKRASLVGNSYGGFLAMSQASLTPERVNRVVLINPAGIFVSVLSLASPFMRLVLLLALKLKKRPEKFDLAAYIGRDVQFRPDERELADMIGIVMSSAEMKPHLILPTVFRTAELRAIAAPTLLLMGDNDLIYDPIAAARTAQRRMPALQVEILKGAHHIAAMAQPEEANRRMLRFLQYDLPQRATA